MTKRFLPLCTLILSILCLAACTSKQPSQYMTDKQGQTVILDPFNPHSILASQRTVFFEDNGYTVAPKYHAMLQIHGHYLSQHPQQKIRIQGYTDNQGSVEYNLAIGQRRSVAVAQILVQYGAIHEQIESISFGKLTMPHDASSSPIKASVSDYPDRLDAHARRAEIHYLKP